MPSEARVGADATAIHLSHAKQQSSLGDVQGACQKSAEAGFVAIRNGIFAHPTEIGEQLIAATSGRPLAATFAVPDLPAKTW